MWIFWGGLMSSDHKVLCLSAKKCTIVTKIKQQQKIWLCGKFLFAHVLVCSTGWHAVSLFNTCSVAAPLLICSALVQVDYQQPNTAPVVLRVNPSASGVRRSAPRQSNQNAMRHPPVDCHSSSLFGGVDVLVGGSSCSCKLRFVVSAGTAGRTSTAAHCDA